MSRELLDKQNLGAFASIIRESDIILAQNKDILARAGRHADGSLDLGLLPECPASSDAVTRAAQDLGFIAARELLLGYHFVTSLGDPSKNPSRDDLIICRTWGQFYPDLYNGDHPISGKPFLGTRSELGALLPSRIVDTFIPAGVELRQTLHKPMTLPTGRGCTRHAWLATTPDQLAARNYPMGLLENFDLYAEEEWL